MIQLMTLVWTLISFGFGCELGNEPLYPAIYEQAINSGSIIRGIVHKVENDIVTLKKTQFLKGCGPRTVVIKGFKGFSNCGVDPPNLKSEVLVFVCKESFNRRWWRLNDYTNFSGLIPAHPKNLKIIKQYSSENNICANCCSYISECKESNGNETPKSVESFANKGLKMRSQSSKTGR